MAMNKDHFHTHGPDELAMLRAECDKWHKAYDRVWEERMRFADRAIELEKENSNLNEERRWRKCSEELPTAKDANESGKLLGYLGGFKIAHEYHWTDVRDKLYGITHWMPLPKAPEEYK